MHIFRMATAENTNLKFEFPVEGQKYLVKNFTDGNIYAGLGDGTNKAKMILIPPKTSEIIFNSERYSDLHTEHIVTVIPDMTSEEGVEVRCLGWLAERTL